MGCVWSDVVVWRDRGSEKSLGNCVGEYVSVCTVRCGEAQDNCRRQRDAIAGGAVACCHKSCAIIPRSLGGGIHGDKTKSVCGHTCEAAVYVFDYLVIFGDSWHFLFPLCCDEQSPDLRWPSLPPPVSSPCDPSGEHQRRKMDQGRWLVPANGDQRY